MDLSSPLVVGLKISMIIMTYQIFTFQPLFSSPNVNLNAKGWQLTMSNLIAKQITPKIVLNNFLSQHTTNNPKPIVNNVSS